MDITKLEILKSKWKAHQDRKDELIGKCLDGTMYVIAVPFRLRDELRLLQNALVDKANEAKALQLQIDSTKKKLQAMLDSLSNISEFEPIPVPSVEEEYNSLSSTIPHIGGAIVDGFTSD